MSLLRKTSVPHGEVISRRTIFSSWMFQVCTYIFNFSIPKLLIMFIFPDRCQYCHTQLRLGSYAFDRDGMYGFKFFCLHHFGMVGELEQPAAKVVRKPSQRLANDQRKSPEKKAISGISGVDLLDRGKLRYYFDVVSKWIIFNIVKSKYHLYLKMYSFTVAVVSYLLCSHFTFYWLPEFSSYQHIASLSMVGVYRVIPRFDECVADKINIS